MLQPEFVPLQHATVEPKEVLSRAEAFYRQMNRRRSVRHFSDRPVPRDVIEHLILAASTAPSGAHRQPWTYVAVCDPATKQQIRQAAEVEERKSYEERMPADWKEALEPFGTDWHKPYLEMAPWLVVLFQQRWGTDPSGENRKHYYVTESVGISAGLFLTAVHQAGLVALTHTPSPMGFLGEILKRPENEKAFLLMPVGYPAADCQVPDLTRKPLAEVATFVE